MSQLRDQADAQRRARGETLGQAGRERLHLLPQVEHAGEPLAASLWQGDPDGLSPHLTSLADWPVPSAFTPLINAALAAGNYVAAEQLRQDQRLCTAMRRKLRKAERSGAGNEVAAAGL
jgi:hypothetical protein